MKMCTNFQTNEVSSTCIMPDSLLLKIPKAWNTWFAFLKPTVVAYIQDPVHIAVKLKTRILCPSSVLPMGAYVAGIHHLHIIQANFGEGEKDLNIKDNRIMKLQCI